MTFRLMLAAAALMLPAFAQANSQPSNSNSANERVVDSFCDRGSCQRVYEQRAVAGSPQRDRRQSRQTSVQPADPDRYVVRIEPDRTPHSPLAISGR
jgi:hypothetical protein